MEAVPEPKPQPIFMKMVENYILIIEKIEKERNSKFKKKVNGRRLPLYKFTQLISLNTAPYKEFSVIGK